jgi:hypothetical protein
MKPMKRRNVIFITIAAIAMVVLVFYYQHLYSKRQSVVFFEIPPGCEEMSLMRADVSLDEIGMKTKQYCW